MEVRDDATLVDRMIFFSAKARIYRQAANDCPLSRELFLSAAALNSSRVGALASSIARGAAATASARMTSR